MKYDKTLTLFGYVLVVSIGGAELFLRPVYSGLFVRDISCRPVTIISLILLPLIGYWGHSTGRRFLRDLSVIVFFTILMSL
jgi:hypothetical protein